MDNREYYRILGLREDATREQIEKAYKEKARKLKSEDYSDDPEYVAKRTAKLRHAYNVLTGSSAPVTREQKEARFERLKDALDGGEDTMAEAREEFEKKFKQLKSKVSPREREREERRDSGHIYRTQNNRGQTVIRLGEEETAAKRTNFGRARYSSGSGKKAALIVTIVIIGISILSSLTPVMMNSFYDDDYTDYDYDSQDYIEEVHKAVDYIYSINSEYNFERVLDTSEQEENLQQVEWEATDEVYEQLWDCTYDLTDALQIYSMSDAVEYITGDVDYYWEHDDLENGLVLASVMNPPSFEEVAGAVDIYSNEAILDYIDYFHFLLNVAEGQTVFADFSGITY